MIVRRLKSFYQPGGALPLDSPAYVRRAADEELFAFLMHGEFCSILASRQMGKSSLIARTSARLRTQNVATCVIDLSGMSDAGVDPDKWYLALSLKIGKALDREPSEIAELWSTSEWPTPPQRWTACIEKLLSHGEAAGETFRLVVFLDEIDATRDMSFKDGFFATIRSCYNRRSVDALFRRLAFCLVGSARPTDLIADPNLTPFNIGRRIEITDFSEEEAQALIPGMERDDAEGRALLQRVLYWTGGHPYLTHRLCMQIAEAEAVCKPGDVDRLAESLFFSIGNREQDDNLAFVSHRVLTSCASERDVARILSTYDEVLRGKPVRDEKSDSVLGVLHLAGIVRSEGGLLAVRNRVYSRVFDRAWVRENMPGAQLRMVRAAYWRAAFRWSGVAAALAVLAAYALVLRRVAVRNEATATHLAHVEHVILMQSMQALWEHADLVQMEANLRSTPVSERNFEWRYWLRQMHQNLRTLSDPQAGGERVAAAAFSPDGSWLATSGKFPFIDIWDPKTGVILHRLAEPQSPYTLALDVSPDGRRLVSGGDGEVARLWDTKTWEPVATLDMGTTNGEVACVRFSPDGKLVGAAMVNGAGVRVFDSQSGRLLYHFPTGTTFALAFDPAAPLVAVAGDLNRAALWRLGSRQASPDAVLAGPDPFGARRDFAIVSLAFSKDGRRLACGSKDDTVQIWDVPSRRIDKTLWQSENGVSSVAFTPQGDKVLAVGLDRTIRAWNVLSGEQVSMVPAHAQWINSVAISRDGLVATTSDDGTCKLWPLNDGSNMDRLPTNLASTGKGVTVNGKYLLLMLDSGNRLGWLEPQSKTWIPIGVSLPSGGCLAFGSSQDGHILEAIDSQGRILRWSSNKLRDPPVITRLPPELVPVLNSAALSPNADRALITLITGQVVRIDLATGTYQFISSARCSQRSEAAWGPGSHPLWAVGTVGRRMLYISDPDFAQPPQRLPLDSSGGLHLSKDGSHVLITSSTSDHEADPTLLDLRTMRTRRLVGHTTACNDADFSPDGTRIVTAGADNTVRLWDAAEAINLQTWRFGFTPYVTFAPDGNYIVVLNDYLDLQGSGMRLLNAATPAEVATWTKSWPTPQ